LRHELGLLLELHDGLSRALGPANRQHLQHHRTMQDIGCRRDCQVQLQISARSTFEEIRASCIQLRLQRTGRDDDVCIKHHRRAVRDITDRAAHC
jgi:hypothetical protein